MHFDEALEKVNSTAVIRDWLTLLLEVDLTQSDVAPEQLNAIKSLLQENTSERCLNNVKRMVLADMHFDEGYCNELNLGHIYRAMTTLR